ncbi:MAG: imelysin family protein [Candidatus Microthrix subdominans]
MKLRTPRSTTARSVKRTAIGALAVVGLLTGCSGGTDRGDVLADLATQGAETLEALPEVAAAATAAVETACASGEKADFDAAAEDVAAAQTRWHEAEAFWLGPATDLRSNSIVDWPANAQDVDDLVAAEEPATIDVDYLAAYVGADTRGYGAVLTLLEQAPLDERQCDYANAATALAESGIDAVTAAWTDPDDGEPYRDELADPEVGIDAVVNHLLALLANKDAANLEARSNSVEDLLFGPEGDSGLSALLDDDLTAQLRSETDELIAATKDGEAAADDEPSEAALAAMNELRATVATQVVAELGVTVTFSDADGDSAG